MTDSSIIQDARNVLARVRAASTPRPWVTDVSYAAHPVGAFMSANVVVHDWDVATFGGADLAPDRGQEERARADRALYLLTTDPELLDAIDGMLADFAWQVPLRSVERIAAAVVAANERMSA